MHLSIPIMWWVLKNMLFCINNWLQKNYFKFFFSFETNSLVKKITGGPKKQVLSVFVYNPLTFSRCIFSLWYVYRSNIRCSPALTVLLWAQTITSRLAGCNMLWFKGALQRGVSFNSLAPLFCRNLCIISMYDCPGNFFLC